MTMKNNILLIDSKIIESKKSTFFVEILENSSGNKYVTIEQIVRIDNDNQHSVKIRINPIVLDKIIEALMEMEVVLTNQKKEKSFSKKIQKEIVRRYLIGVEIDELAMQFRCDANAIRNVLIMNNVEITNQRVPGFIEARLRGLK